MRAIGGGPRRATALGRVGRTANTGTGSTAETIGTAWSHSFLISYRGTSHLRKTATQATQRVLGCALASMDQRFVECVLLAELGIPTPGFLLYTAEPSSEGRGRRENEPVRSLWRFFAVPRRSAGGGAQQRVASRRPSGPANETRRVRVRDPRGIAMTGLERTWETAVSVEYYGTTVDAHGHGPPANDPDP